MEKTSCKYNCGMSYTDKGKLEKHEKRCKLKPKKTRGKYNIVNPRKPFSIGPRPKKLWSCRYCNHAKFDKQATRDKHERKYHNKFTDKND